MCVSSSLESLGWSWDTHGTDQLLLPHRLHALPDPKTSLVLVPVKELIDPWIFISQPSCFPHRPAESCWTSLSSWFFCFFYLCNSFKLPSAYRALWLPWRLLKSLVLRDDLIQTVFCLFSSIVSFSTPPFFFLQVDDEYLIRFDKS